MIHPVEPSQSAAATAGHGDAFPALARAEGFWGRLRGLMLRPGLPPEVGLLLPGCASVHTCFMRFALDLVYLDRAGKVVKLVAAVRPWRFSYGGRQAAQVLELSAGSIGRLGIGVGDDLQGVLTPSSPPPAGQAPLQMQSGRTASTTVRQRGASMVEFTVVGPIITLLGLGCLQYGMLFFAKNQINHASFMAARAGSMGNAKLQTVQDAYVQALIPLYGGGRNQQELADAKARVVADLLPGAAASNFQVAVLNPRKESFDDWNDPLLQARYGARAIPNGGQAWKDLNALGAQSHQNIQDANLLQLRIMQGYQPKVPVVGRVWTSLLQLADPGTNPFYTQLVNSGRIPVVTDVTLQMQSDPVEQTANPTPIDGNKEPPGDQGTTDTGGPAACNGADCGTNGSGNSGGVPSSNTNTCNGPPVTESLAADPLFDFGKSSITDQGKRVLDRLIASARGRDFSSLTVTGYTDQLANPGFDNNQLSLDRAVAVRNYLQSHGLDSKPIEVEGMGASNPRVPLSICPASGRARIDCLAPNRRVEITFNKGDA